MRDGETLVAGHSAETMQEYYDLKSKKTTQTVISSLDKKYEMDIHMKDLEASNINSEKDEEFFKFKEAAEDDQKKRLLKHKEEQKDKVIPTFYWNQFVEVANKNCSGWLKSRATMSPCLFKKLTLQLILRKCDLQESFFNMLMGENESYNFLQYVNDYNFKKMKKNKKLLKTDEEVLLQALDWIYKEAIIVLSNNEANPSESVDSSVAIDNKLIELKRSIELNVALPRDVDNIPTEQLIKMMCPSVYSKDDMNVLLNEASRLDESDWFLRANSSTTYFNLNRMEFEIRKDGS